MAVHNTSSAIRAGAAGAAASGFYTHIIENSLRVDYDAQNYLEGAALSIPDTNVPWSASFWVQRALTGAYGSSSYSAVIGHDGGGHVSGFNDDNTFRVETGLGGQKLETNRIFTDTSAWYHIFYYASSTTRQIYVNGLNATLGTSTWGSSTVWYNGAKIQIGATNSTSSGARIFVGHIAEFFLFYNQQKAYTDFGEFKSGVWIPKKYTGGFAQSRDIHLKFENSGNLGLDSSGNGNNFTSNNLDASHQSTNTPTFS